MSPSEPPIELPGLVALALLLGARHGFDADHLATIDGLTRLNARDNPRLARLAGTLFSLGHGALVLAVTLVAVRLASGWRVPHWLDALGAWLSIGFLALLGLANLVAVARTHPDQMVRVRGIRAVLLGSRVVRRTGPAGILLVGALFAVSFDTVSQAALFALAAGRFDSGWPVAALLAGAFTAGMIVVDGVNGLWIARLLRSSGARARVASRVMGLGVASASLLVAALGATRQLWPAADAWADGKELATGAVVIVLVLSTFVVGQRLARQRAPAAPG